LDDDADEEETEAEEAEEAEEAAAEEEEEEEEDEGENETEDEGVRVVVGWCRVHSIASKFDCALSTALSSLAGVGGTVDLL